MRTPALAQALLALLRLSTTTPPAARAFMPDKLVAPDRPGYRAGRDPLTDWILSEGG